MNKVITGLWSDLSKPSDFPDTIKCGCGPIIPVQLDYFDSLEMREEKKQEIG